ncbi:hypothetical protein ABZ782_35695 [Streptomyces asoensis]|uniref:hypothetical protein n=1 Tax=Streptomyces asoensis TaxID=249586 RepID=UPI0033D0D9B6
MPGPRKTAWGAIAAAMVLTASACSAERRATSPEEVQKLAGSAVAEHARQESEKNLRDVVRAYDERTPLTLDLLVMRDTCLGGAAKQWIDSNGDDLYKIRCSMQITAYYGADPQRIVAVLDGILTVGDLTGSLIPFTRDAYQQFITYYRKPGKQSAEVPEFSRPSHTLSWDPVREPRPYLLLKEPDACPNSEPPLFRCLREPKSSTIGGIRKRYGMVFKLDLQKPEYYKALKNSRS